MKIGWLGIVLLIGLLVGLVRPVRAIDCKGNLECERLQSQINDLAKEIEIRSEANERNATEMRQLETRVKELQRQINGAKITQKELEAGIQEREEDLALQYLLFAKKTREYYKRLRSQQALAWLFGELGRDLGYREVAVNQDRALIVKIAGEIKSLETDKLELEENSERLVALQASLDKQAKFLEGEVAGVSAYLASLENKIAQMSALQQSVLSSKAETFSTTVGDVPLADDYSASIEGFRKSAPAGSLAVFSFGAPHFKGMSQYGAYGRAKSGQNAEEILRAYYGGVEIKKDYSTSINITVQGYGTVDIETYAKRIYEVPNAWGEDGFEALKAQAVAARSYALAYTNNGAGSICATEACQVYKPANKGGKWEEAVEATRGWVLVANGQPFSAWYASTSGGYQKSYTAQGHTTPGFWDTKSGRGGWTNEAYEKIAKSPWFYKAWYKSRSGDDCGRGNPWLTAEEMADIVNAWVVIYQKGESDDRVTPIGPCWGGNPYSIEELKAKGGYSRVTSASVVYRDDGLTDQVTLGTDKGAVTIDGSGFKAAFNLRAPGRIALKSGLFNIEVK